MTLIRYSLFFLALATLSNCGLFKTKTPTDATTRLDNRAVNQIVREARRHVGTPYKYGGTGDEGFDCSGLVTVAFNSVGFKLPRVSADMAEVGQKVDVKDVRAGDLLFFVTSKTGSRINHVGIVTERRSDSDIRFIHAADSGVREDNLFTKYYQKTFVKAMRPF